MIDYKSDSVIFYLQLLEGTTNELYSTNCG